MADPQIVKIRVRGSAGAVETAVSQIKRVLVVAEDSSNYDRGRFVDRYLSVVLDGLQLVDVETGEIVN